MSVLAVLLVLVVGVYVRLAQGPVSLDFLRTTVQNKINQSLPNMTVTVGGVVLQRTGSAGVPHVLLADALAEAVHSIARVGPLSGDAYRLAAELGMPPWRVQKAQKQSRRWSRESVATAIGLVAALNADVKGAAADADYVLENVVRKVAELAAAGGR